MAPKSKKSAAASPKPDAPPRSDETGAAAEGDDLGGGAGALPEVNAVDSLVAALMGGGAVSTVADLMIKQYREESADAALCTIINAVCRASGVQEVEIDSASLHQEGSIVTTLEELFARVPQESAAYYLVNKDPKYKRFRKSLPEFFEQLVTLAYSSDVLFDNVFTPVLLQWLIAMTESKARSFRHTSTVAILGFMEGLNHRIVFVKDSIQSLKKKDASAAQKRLENLMALQEHVFTSAVHQRVKDVAPEIRLAVLSALKSWCIDAPTVYVTNKYLRYFSIGLYDKKAELRAQGLDAIIHIMAAHSGSGALRMRDFLKYFADRLVEMTSDVDTHCADLAIKVATLIVRADSEAGESEEVATLSNDMIDKVLLSLFDDRAVIRTSAGTFLKVFIRCRVGTDDDNSSTVRTELLCTFASIFRNTYAQEQPERYLVDAIWKQDNPPSMLTEYKPILDMVQKGGEDTVVALSMLAALLERLKGPMTFGPPSKDDIKVAVKHDTAKDSELATLRVRLSKDLGVVLHKVIEAGNENGEILGAVADVLAVLDLHVFTTAKENEKICDAFTAFRKSISVAPIADRLLILKLTTAWTAILFTEYPQKDFAKAQLSELVKQSLAQLQAAERSQSRSSQDASQAGKKVSDLVRVWSRIQIITALVPLRDQFVLFRNAFKRQVNSKAHPDLLAKMVPIATQSALWQLADIEADPSLNPQSIAEDMHDTIALLLDVAAWDSESTKIEPGVLETQVDAFAQCADLALLQSTLTQQQQELMVEVAIDLFTSVSETLRLQQETLRDAIKSSTGEASNVAPVAVARSCLSKWEAALTKVSMAVVRLVVFQKISETLAPQVLLLWTRSQFKVVSDIFKAMFHMIRERVHSSYAIEKEILLAAYKQCAEQGSNPQAVEALYQIGVKLASMHFALTDKHYTDALKLVRYGVEFATTVDPTILNAVGPYCARLRPADALQIANALPQHELFVEATSPYAQSFISAVRRAAKLEDAAAGAASATPWRTSKKRARELTAQTTEQADELLAAVTKDGAARRSLPPAKPQQQQPRGAAVSSKKGTPPAARSVTADGWRVRAEDEALLSQALAASKRHLRTGTQDSAPLSSALAEIEDEVFVATQEFE